MLKIYGVVVFLFSGNIVLVSGDVQRHQVIEKG